MPAADNVLTLQIFFPVSSLAPVDCETDNCEVGAGIVDGRRADDDVDEFGGKFPVAPPPPTETETETSFGLRRGRYL